MTAMLTRDQRAFIETATQILDARRRREQRKQFYRMFPKDDTVQPDGSMFFAREKYAKHLEFFEAGAKYRERCFMAANRIGKALRDGTKVATPDGWVPIERLSVGDEVISGAGVVTKVMGVFPQGAKKLYRVTFDRGHWIDACPEHLWRYQHPKARYPMRHSHGKKEPNPNYGAWSTATTEDILSQVGGAPGPRMRPLVPSSKAWVLPKQSLLLDPYLLGVLLGDGCLHKETIKISTGDPEIAEMARAACPGHATVRHLGGIEYSVVRTSGAFNPVFRIIKQLGLHDHRSHEKFVPKPYLFSDIDDRSALLRGLMDTDGTISKSGTPQFSSTSFDLITAVEHLVITLGGTARIKQRQTYCNGKPGLPSWVVSMRLDVNPFRLQRKAAKWAPLKNTMERVIQRIEPAPDGHATCIEVEHASHTYVTEHGIVTHNTFGAGGYEAACHLTGEYPRWWKGRRFTNPIRAWAAGKTNETTRDIVQAALLGNITQGKRKYFDGCGVIPGQSLGGLTWKQGVSDLVDTIRIKHKPTGGWSVLGLKSYQQGRGSFEGTAQHLIWFDEEPPLDVYGEALIRTATTNGILMLTFTPLAGHSRTVAQFMPQEDHA